MGVEVVLNIGRVRAVVIGRAPVRAGVGPRGIPVIPVAAVRPVVGICAVPG